MAPPASQLVTLLISIVLLLSVSSQADAVKQPWKRVIKVDQSGSGHYTKIQEAIDSVPNNYTDGVFIRIEPGIYEEQVVVPEDKPYIFMSGRKAETTVITSNSGGDIHQSPTFTVFAPNFVARYLTFQNTRGVGERAVALRVVGDKAAFYACRMVAYQDTVLAELGRQFYSNCYIEGAVDFICGSSSAVFQNCHVHSTSDGGSAITAQKRMTEDEESGFYFVGGKVTGVKTCVLGRPWGPFSRVVFAYTFMSAAVSPQGWDNWRNPKLERTAYYGEYKCYGRGANRSGRVTWSRGLTTQEASPFLSTDVIKGKQWINLYMN
ncbi:hypothetical protein V2J09_023777 [Rumex salicifolius]